MDRSLSPPPPLTEDSSLPVKECGVAAETYLNVSDHLLRKLIKVFVNSTGNTNFLSIMSTYLAVKIHV